MPNPAHLYKSASSSSRVNVHLTTSISTGAVPFERVASSRSIVDSQECMDVDEMLEKGPIVSNGTSDGERALRLTVMAPIKVWTVAQVAFQDRSPRPTGFR